MSFDLMSFMGPALQKQAISEILSCNETSALYGLELSEKQASELVEMRFSALASTGRIEFGGGIIDKIILAFCNSPYITQNAYTSLLEELVEIFYIYKSEMLDKISDDDLIKLMKHYFDGTCQGSAELLKCRELEAYARSIRFGFDVDSILKEEDSDDQEDSENEEY